jgi:hypothetical protein
MLNILSSKAAQPNDAFVELKREARENNLQWLRRALKAAPGDGAKPARLLLSSAVWTRARSACASRNRTCAMT